MPMIGYKIFKEIAKQIVYNKNNKNIGMTEWKDIYTNDDVTWPKRKKKK